MQRIACRHHQERELCSSIIFGGRPR